MKKVFISMFLFIGFSGFYACIKDQLKPTGELSERIESREASADIPNLYDPNNLVATGAQVMQLGEGYSFTEGPAVDKFGNVYFTDQPNDKIYKWSASSNQVTTFLSKTGRSNGMYFDKDGFLITCADLHGELWKIDAQGNHTVLFNEYNKKLLNGPNDIWINPTNGGMYFTDPLFGRDYWDASDPRKVKFWPGTSQQADPIGSNNGGYVYYVNPQRTSITRVATEALGWSPSLWVNGIIGTPDGKKLYVNKWGFNTDVSGTWSFDINADGSLSNLKKFAEMGGDGMTIDEIGNVYIANNRGITAFDPQGTRIFNLPVPPGGSNNVTFAGQSNNILFYTGQSKVYGLKMNVKGSTFVSSPYLPDSKQKALSIRIKASPNPTKGIVTLTSTAAFEILDVISPSNTSLGIKTTKALETTIDLSNYAAGNYSVKLYQGNVIKNSIITKE